MTGWAVRRKLASGPQSIYTGKRVIVHPLLAAESPRKNAFPYDELASGRGVYAYVGGNPTTLTDPSGLCPLWDSFTATDAQAISIQQQIDYLVSQLTRLPDYISFNINAYVGSVFSAFASTGNAFVGGGVNFNAPNPANLEASVNVGWLNTINPSADHIDNFLSSYSGGVTGGYIGVGGGVAWSPGNGTATVIGFGAGESFGTSFKGGSNASWGYSVNTGYTGITW